MKIPRQYRFRVKPWAHQTKALELSWDKPEFALFMEQGTGKSKVGVDTAGLLYGAGKIDATFILAPNGVQRAWTREVLPAQMSPVVPYVAAFWRNQQTKTLAAEIDRLWDDRFVGMRVLSMNFEMLLTKEGYKTAKMFLNGFRSLMIVDESHKIKDPDSGRTKKTLSLADFAPYRRIMTGTPIDGAPFAMFSQMAFLNVDILGVQSYVSFKAEYAVLVDENNGTMQHIMRRLVQKYGEKRARHMRPALVQRDENGKLMYRNLDRLRELVAPYSYRVLKKDCLDLPPKVYQKRTVELTSEQRRIYNELREEFMVEYEGKLMTAVMVMARMMRLQQIAGGFFKPTRYDDEIEISGGNPKLDDLLDVCEEAGGKVIVWARFAPELDVIVTALTKEYGAEVVFPYHGRISDGRKEKNKLGFIKTQGKAFFVAQQQAGGTGLDGLQVADTEVFYSNEMSLLTRLQAEDRGHRGGSEVHDKVTIIDICAEDTVDYRIMEILRSGRDVADAITGDPKAAWI